MLFTRFGLVALGILVACGSDVTSESSAGNGGATSASSASSTSGSGGSGGSVAGSGVGGGSAVICNPNGVLCDALPPTCPPGEVPSVEGACWGGCVPILTCQTEPSCDGCPSGFCAEYQAFTVEYRCAVPSLRCSALTCSCLAPYFCVSPFDACTESIGPADVSCGCPTC